MIKGMRISRQEFEKALNIVLEYQNQIIKDIQVLKVIPQIVSKNDNIFSEENIKDHPLSIRVMNCLKAAEINTYGQLDELMKNKPLIMLRWRNFGKDSYQEVLKFYESILVK